MPLAGDNDVSITVTNKALGPVAYQRSDGTLGSITWTAGWPVTVRSSADPWVQTSRTTNGRMVFGIKDETTRYRGAILISVGSIALSPFLLLCTMCFCGACIKSCCRRVKDAVDTATRPTFVGAFRDEVSERVSVETRWCEPGSAVGWWCGLGSLCASWGVLLSAQVRSSIRTITRRSNAAAATVSRRWGRNAGGPISSSPPGGIGNNNDDDVESGKGASMRSPAPLIVMDGASPAAGGGGGGVAATVSAAERERGGRRIRRACA